MPQRARQEWGTRGGEGWGEKQKRILWGNDNQEKQKQLQEQKQKQKQLQEQKQKQKQLQEQKQEQKQKQMQKQKQLQEQEQKRIFCGNDNQRCKGKGRDKGWSG